MNVMNGQLIEWMSSVMNTCSKLRDKFMYWKSQSWPFHVCLKVVQCIMEPMILYYLPFVLFCNLFDICCGRRGIRWESHGLCGIIQQHQALGGARILDLSMHMMDRRISLLQDMGSDSQPWISIDQYCIENKMFNTWEDND